MRTLALAGSLLGLALAAAQPAAAGAAETDCAHLAATLTAATPGETIVLSGMCTSPDNSFILPATAALTIEGAAAGVNGFDGTEASGPALYSPEAGTDGLTVRNLTFQNFEGQGGVHIKSTKTAAHAFTFAKDTFKHDSVKNNGGGLSLIVEEPGAPCSFADPGPPVTLTESSFTANTSTFQAGGGAYIDLECAAGTISASVTNNVFLDNKVAADIEPLQGGGLWVGLGHEIYAVPFAISQQGNLLEGNAVENTGAGGHMVAGGGEFTDGGPVTSLDDRFLNNRISGAQSTTTSSEGGGLSSLDPGECSKTPGVSSTATNLIAAGNSIGAPGALGGGGEGAGVYVGCRPGGGGYHLTLLNSTISGNAATGSGAAAGLDGEVNDTAVLENTIVAANLGAPDLGGFGASDGEHVSASFSDLCAIGAASSPFTGAGNICGAPLLVNAPGGDAHETPSSPTIDGGSNALSGSLATDAFGAPRIQPGRSGDGAIVDIGAAEITGPPAGKPPPLPAPGSEFGTVRASHLKAIPGGISVTIACAGASGQTCGGSVSVSTVETLRGRRVIAVAGRASKRRRVTILDRGATFSGLKPGQSLTLRLKLNARGRALLARFHHLPAQVLITERTGHSTVATVARTRLSIVAARARRRH